MSFTNQFLKHKGLEIFDCNNSPILVFKEIRHENRFLKFRPNKPVIKIDVTKKEYEVGFGVELEEIKSYEDVKRRGYVIISLRARNPWMKAQRAVYQLCPITQVRGKVYPQIPPRHSITFNPLTKKIRLEGPNSTRYGFGPWKKILTE